MRDSNYLLLIERLIVNSKKKPQKVALKFLNPESNTYQQLTYHELLIKIKRVAFFLHSRLENKPVLLLFDAGIDYIVSFLATLMAGGIAVTAYPPRKTRHQQRLIRIIEDSRISLILTKSSIQHFCEVNQFTFPAKTEIFAVDALHFENSDFTPPEIKRSDIAFLQYTSGSTGNPKGVMVTHANIAANLNVLFDLLGPESLETCVSWLPIFHDMGLIGCTLLPLYYGGTTVFMSPVSFLKNPFFWLKAMSEHKATYTMAPNFAYELMLRHIPENCNIDLSNIHHLINGAEPVKISTIKQVESILSKFGLKAGAIKPGYGMAETTLAITANTCPVKIVKASKKFLEKGVLAPPSQVEDTNELVHCGKVAPHHYKLRIVCPETKVVLENGQIGEIWIQGESVTNGYYHNEEKTQEYFKAFLADGSDGPFLRTGDLGVIDGKGNLIICGRLKDIIIIQGRNLYPQDIEKACYSSHKNLIENACAAFSIQVDNEENIVVVAEATRHLSQEDYSELLHGIKRAIFDETNCIPHDIVLIPTKTLPKTTSGKIQRQACMELYLKSELDTLASLKSEQNNQKEQIAKELNQDEALSTWMKNWIAKYNLISVTTVTDESPFADYNLDSVAQVQFIHDLENFLGKKIETWLLWQYPNIKALSHYLLHDSATESISIKKDYESIAIVGIGCRFPGPDGQDIQDVESFWNFLLEEKDAIAQIPLERWDNRLYFSKEVNNPGKTYASEGGFLHQIKRFDAAFFNISPREAELLDPQQRLCLEVTWHALEDANITPSSLKNTNTAIYLGISTHDYDILIQKHTDLVALGTYQATGTSFATAAGRLAYFLGTQGPCMAIDTACSSSLVTVHQAARALQEHESDLAIAGGVNLILSPEGNIIFSKSGMLSKTNRCHTFDKNADGYVRGEGCGMVVLKRLDDALRDKNKIYAVIHGSCVNQDGASNGLTAPNLNAQIKVMKTALSLASLSPEKISHIEAHGTGTPLGDPVEWEGIRQVFAQNRNTPFYITSLKTRIGHLEAAAGIAALIKTALALKYQTIPAHLNFTALNPEITPHKNMVIPVHKQENIDELQYAGVSSFGFSGTNTHVILGRAPETNDKEVLAANTYNLWVLSAKEESTLINYFKQYRKWAEKKHFLDFEAMSYYMQIGREHFSHRCFIVAKDKEEWLKSIDKCPSIKIASTPPSVAWMFTGQGSLVPNVAADLYNNSPYFATILDECCKRSEPLLPYSLKNLLLETPQYIDINNTFFAQPVLYVFEYVLAQWWLALGLKPSVLIGHSIGEYVAAAIAGVFSFAEGLSLVCARARLMSEIKTQGEMLAIFCELEEAKAIQSEWNDIDIAAYNNPGQVVFSGPQKRIRELSSYCESKGHVTRLLQTSNAFHSRLMEPMISEFRAISAQLTYRSPHIPIISNISGELCQGDTFTSEYWCQQILNPVKFLQGLSTLASLSIPCVIEIGPTSVLTHFAEQFGKFRVIPSIQNPCHGFKDFLTSVGTLYLEGYNFNWQFLHKRTIFSDLGLLLYPFKGKSYWLTIHQKKINAKYQDELIFQTAFERAYPESEGGFLTPKSYCIITRQTHLRDLDKLTPFFDEVRLVPYKIILKPDLLNNPAANQDMLIYISQASIDEFSEETLFFYDVIHDQTLQNRLKPMVFVIETSSVIGQGLVAALKAIHKEHNEWPIKVILADTLENPLVWHTVKESHSYTDWQLRVTQTEVLQETLTPYLFNEIKIQNRIPLAKKVYLITGATGYLGQYLVEQLLKEGARTIIALGRSSTAPAWSETIQKYLRDKKVCLDYYSADTQNREALKDFLKLCQNKYPPITSIIHMAGETRDKPWADTSAQDLLELAKGKAMGAWHLHELTQNLELEDFVLFSSIAAVFGSEGQSAYALANGCLLALCSLRNTKGLPALCLALGPVKGSPMVLQSRKGLLDKMQLWGLNLLEREKIWPLLSSLTDGVFICAALDLEKYNSAKTEQKIRLASQNPILPKAGAPDTEMIKELASQVLKINLDKLQNKKNWFELGMDSIMSGQLAFAINKFYPNAGLTAKEIFQFPDADTLCQYLKNKMQEQTPAKITSQNGLFCHNHSIPLSLQQQEIWNYLKTCTNPEAYYIPMQIELEGFINPEQFLDSIKSVTRQHDVFFYSFHEVLGQVSIHISDEPKIEIKYTEQFTESLFSDFFLRPFNIEEGILSRFLLIKKTSERYIWLCLFHHLITDGQSIKRIIDEVFHHYSGIIPKKPSLTYADYISWQHQNYFHNQAHDLLRIWSRRLKEFPVDTPIVENTELPMEAGLIHFEVPHENYRDLKEILSSEQLTINNAILQALSHTLLTLFKRSKQSLVIFFSGREINDFSDVIGDLSNDVIVCLDATTTNSTLHAMKLQQQQLFDLVDNQYFRIQLLKLAGLLPEISYDFQAAEKKLFTSKTLNAVATNYWNVQPYLWGNEPRTLSFKVLQTENSLRFSLKYRKDRISEAKAKNILSAWVNNVNQLQQKLKLNKNTDQEEIFEAKASILQQNLWSLLSGWTDSQNSPYRIPVLRFLAKNYDATRLNNALSFCVTHNPPLRTSFKERDKTLYLNIESDTKLNLNIINTDNLADTISHIFSQPLSNAPSPLVSIWIIKNNNYPDLLLIMINHLIMDGLSGEYFLQKIEDAYYNTHDNKTHSALELHESNFYVGNREENQYAQIFTTNSKYYRSLTSKVFYPAHIQGSQISMYGGLCFDIIGHNEQLNFNRFCQRNKCSAYAAYLQIFSDVVCRHFNLLSLYVSMVKSNRATLKDTNSLGYFADNAPVSIEASKGPHDLLNRISLTQETVLEVMHLLNQPLLIEDLEDSGYRQPDFIFNHYQIFPNSLLFRSAEHVLQEIARTIKSVPLWNYRKPELLNLSIRSIEDGDCLSMIFDTARIDADTVSLLLREIINTIKTYSQ